MPAQRTRWIVLAVVAAVSLATAGGITYAATDRSSQTLHACSNGHGTLRLLQHGRCPHGYDKVSFNRQGPRGRRGAPGHTGPAGPGAFTFRVTSDTTTTQFQDHVIDGMGLTAHEVCSAGTVGTQSSFYLLDTDGSAAYTVNGSYDLAATGAHAFLVYDSGSHPNLATGLGLTEFTQPANQGANSEIVLQYDSGAGGVMTADVAVTRSGLKVLIHVVLSQAAGHCVVQADITPAS